MSYRGIGLACLFAMASQASVAEGADCYDAYNFAQDVYLYTSKASTLDSFDAIQEIEEAVLPIAKDAVDFADVCECPEAKRLLEQALDAINEGSTSTEASSAQYSMSAAASSSQQAMAAAKACGGVEDEDEILPGAAEAERAQEEADVRDAESSDRADPENY